MAGQWLRASVSLAATDGTVLVRFEDLDDSFCEWIRPHESRLATRGRHTGSMLRPRGEPRQRLDAFMVPPARAQMPPVGTTVLAPGYQGTIEEKQNMTEGRKEERKEEGRKEGKGRKEGRKEENVN